MLCVSESASTKRRDRSRAYLLKRFSCTFLEPPIVAARLVPQRVN